MTLYFDQASIIAAVVCSLIVAGLLKGTIGVGMPVVAALFGIFVHFAGFWPLSSLNLLLAVMTMAVVVYDLWVLGGAAAKINRLTDEFKAER